ncbi:conserved hypothetical protein [Mycobacterium tuberculosis CPHL_A]|nr:conserved hypothetical protein [Mycobacterium tuberculosis CPHL_A]
MKRLDLVAGPNGAGKSTFVALTLAPLLPGIVFVNADEIAKQRWPDDPTSHAYQAAQVAADTRARLIDLGRPFIAETVFSHPSKLELIRTARTAATPSYCTCWLSPKAWRSSASGIASPRAATMCRRPRSASVTAGWPSLSPRPSRWPTAPPSMTTAGSRARGSSLSSAGVASSGAHAGLRGRRHP